MSTSTETQLQRLGLHSYKSHNHPEEHYLWEDVRLALDPIGYETLRRWASDNPEYVIGDVGITVVGVQNYPD